MNTKFVPLPLREINPDDYLATNPGLRRKNQVSQAPPIPFAIAHASYSDRFLRDVGSEPATAAQPDSVSEALEESDCLLTGDDLEETILRLLKGGESVTQISRRLLISKQLIKRWERQVTQSYVQKTDKRRLYDDDFKHHALEQLKQGVSVRKLSQQVGVSQVTLHKWKNQETTDSYPLASALVHTPSPDGQEESPSTLSDRVPSTHSLDQLRQQVRTLREERDVLKKALLILLRSS